MVHICKKGLYVDFYEKGKYITGRLEDTEKEEKIQNEKSNQPKGSLQKKKSDICQTSLDPPPCTLKALFIYFFGW